MIRILKALEPVFWVATIILVIYWLIALSPSNRVLEGISGWWWFSTALIGTFLSEYNSYE